MIELTLYYGSKLIVKAGDITLVRPGCKCGEGGSTIRIGGLDHKEFYLKTTYDEVVALMEKVGVILHRENRGTNHESE